jgi:hypothetical protein
MNRRLIFVAGTASGGTSAVAGALHHLGVDMGKFLDRNGIRGYATYEDVQMNDYKVKDGPGFRFREYVTLRQSQQTTERIGVKGAANMWIDDEDPASLEMDVLLVNRPLEDSILSDRRIWAIIPEQRPDKAPLTARGFCQRASHVASSFAAKDLLRAVMDPVHEIEYYDLLDDPQMEILRLGNALGLKHSEEQFQAAVRFVDPDRRHV